MLFKHAATEPKYTTLWDSYEEGKKHEDYLMKLDYDRDWYGAFAARRPITYIEINRETIRPMGELSDLWGERIGKITTQRELLVPGHIAWDAPKNQIHSKVALELKQSGWLFYGLGVLNDFDLWPQQGDHIVHTGYRYGIQEVLCRTEDFWQNTNLPITLSCRIAIYREGEGSHEKTINT